MRPKGMEDLAEFNVREESSSRGKKNRQVFPCRRTVRVVLISKVIPTTSLKIEERGTFVVAKDRRKRDGK